MYKRNKETGLVVFWVKLRQRGYTRSISGLYNAMKRMGIYGKRVKKKKPKIKKYELEYNKFPMRPLKWKSPQEFFQEYKAVNING